ncbi:parvulin-like peptidyl-prolyl isomerase [Paraburkholderia bannensis]|uniref:peptidylprolyl isomerase n=1 Tax=Paraburkholderia bannensis TaxID=765414 RepID=A0A7W9WVN2_9BURK|nr:MULTISPECIES: peptidyl-prolyl cis-trans isomerase [Paraburkholderia]MBB3260699.1 parvulin-like peptidyl-prolyl isomerase [Paraburkholderia sp. WP4_3_2]MBB6105869.1 parvulin-like peptidyl-prolyl isomerase [Paraburkholderia bannensis]
MFRFHNVIRAAGLSAFAAMALASSAQAADAPASTLPADAIAVVNGVTVPKSQLDAVVREVSAKTGQPDSLQMRQALKEELIAREVLRQAAVKAHYDTKPEVQQATSADARVGTQIQLYLKDNLHADQVSDDQVKARYEALVASLGKNEFQPRVIAVTDETTAKQVLAKAKSGQAFDALARQYSVAPTKTDGGLMPWVSYPVPVAEGKTQGVPLPLAQTIAQLPVGGISPQPVHLGNVWVIVKLDAKRPPQIPPYDQAKETVKQQLQAMALQKAAAQFTAEQMKNATIQQ